MKKSEKLTMLILIIIAIASVGIAVYYYFESREVKKDTTEKTVEKQVEDDFSIKYTPFIFIRNGELLKDTFLTSIVGKYYVASRYDGPNNEAYIEFNADGTFEANVNVCDFYNKVNGTFKVDGKYIILSYIQNRTIPKEIVSSKMQVVSISYKTEVPILLFEEPYYIDKYGTKSSVNTIHNCSSDPFFIRAN